MSLALPNKPSLGQIQRLEDQMRGLDQVVMEPIHHFAKGIYAREIHIPAGTVLTGKMHKTQHLNVLAKGEITVWTEEGMKRIEAPYVVVSEPGTKRVGYAHTDTVWITFHGTEHTELDKLEDELIQNENLLENAKRLEDN